MKFLLISAILVVSINLISTQIYTTKYDGINLDEILSNKKVLTGYINCVLDKGRCTVDAKELKSHITDALRTGCRKCTAAQKEGTRKVIKHLIQYEKQAWASLRRKYDPSGTFARRYERELKGI